MPIYIGRYGNVANVSYQQNSINKYMLKKSLLYCFALSVWKPKLLLYL